MSPLMMILSFVAVFLLAIGYGVWMAYGMGMIKWKVHLMCIVNHQPYVRKGVVYLAWDSGFNREYNWYMVDIRPYDRRVGEPYRREYFRKANKLEVLLKYREEE